MDAQGTKIPVELHRKRGTSLARLTDIWLSTWGEEVEEEIGGLLPWRDL